MPKVAEVYIILLFTATVNCYKDEPLLYGTLPDGFAWALATASYQIEGAWNEDGTIRHSFFHVVF
jgi:hypothetical protein